MCVCVCVGVSDSTPGKGSGWLPNISLFTCGDCIRQRSCGGIHTQTIQSTRTNAQYPHPTTWIQYRVQVVWNQIIPTTTLYTALVVGNNTLRRCIFMTLGSGQTKRIYHHKRGFKLTFLLIANTFGMRSNVTRAKRLQCCSPLLPN